MGSLRNTKTHFFVNTQNRSCRNTPRPLPVKLLPLPQPHLRMRTCAHTYHSTQRAIQLTGVLARAYSVSIQNLNTVSNTTVP
jgi:hypothetical protein